jgi:pimeloyl-ACP methyl ester carboxylesterase
MKPLLLLHGALGSKSQLEPLRQKLEQNRRIVFTLNFSGHSGEPFQPNFGIAAFADDVIRFMNKQLLSQVDVFGYSMGGYVAVWLAHKFPERIGKIYTLGTKFDWSPESAQKEVRKLDPIKIQEKIPAFARILEHRHAPNDWKVLLEKTSAMMLELGNLPMLTEPVFKSIMHRTVILLGDRDDMADRSYSEQVVTWMPNAVFRLMDETPHPIEKVDLQKLLLMMEL